MTTNTTTKTVVPETEPQRPETPWEQAITRVAAQLASTEFPDPDLAILAHRFRTEKLTGDSGAFWRVLVRSGAPIEPNDGEALRRWAVLISAIARITQKTPTRPNGRTSAHNPSRPLGRALFMGDGPWTGKPHYPESCMQILLSSTGHALRRQAARALDSVAASQGSCDLRQMAVLLHADLIRSRPELDAARLEIAQSYYSLLREQR